MDAIILQKTAIACHKSDCQIRQPAVAFQFLFHFLLYICSLFAVKPAVFSFSVQLRSISGFFYISFTNCSPHKRENPVSFEHKEAASRKHPRRANSNLSNRLRFFHFSSLFFSYLSDRNTAGQPRLCFCVSAYKRPPGTPAGVLRFQIIPPSLQAQQRWRRV